MVISNIMNISDVINNIKSCRDMGDILKILREHRKAFDWSQVELILYSPDLQGFYFTGNDGDSQDAQFRKTLRDVAENTISFEDAEALAEKIHQTGDWQVNLTVLQVKDCFRGYLATCGNDADVRGWGREILGNVLSLMLELFEEMACNEKMTLESEILKQEALRSANLRLLGEMVGGITHDFNNILTGVTGFSQLIQMLDEDPDTQESVADILTASEQGKKIISFISRTKKASTDEAPAQITPGELMTEAAFGLSSRISLEQPGTSSDEFFAIRDNSNTQIEAPQALTQSLLMHIFSGFISAGASSIESTAEMKGTGVEISIRPVFKNKAKITPPVREDCHSAGESGIAGILARKAGFELTAHPWGITLTGPGTPAPTGKIAPGQNLLIFEPDPVLARMYEKLSSSVNATVHLAKTPQQLTTALSQGEKFHRAFVDITALGAVSPDKFPGDLPVVIVTGLGAWTDFSRLEGIFVADVLLKPFSFEDFKNILAGA